MKTAILAAALTATLSLTAYARPGETKDQVDTRFGDDRPYAPPSIPAPMQEMFPEMVRAYQYQSGDFDVVVGFSNGVSIVEFYDKATNELTDKDVQAILIENAGTSTWRSSLKVGPWQLYERKDKAACASKMDGISQVVVFDGRLLNAFLQRYGIDPQKAAAYRASEQSAQESVQKPPIQQEVAEEREILAATNDLPNTLTVDGVRYEQVRWGSATPRAVTIFHKSGVASIPLEKLPPELQQHFGYDPKKEAEKRATAEKLAREKAEEAAEQRAKEELDRQQAEAQAAVTASAWHVTSPAEQSVQQAPQKAPVQQEATVETNNLIDSIIHWLMIYFWVSVAIYFLPTMIAVLCQRRNTVAIAALNLLLGWTALGWIIALVWALCNDRKKN